MSRAQRLLDLLELLRVHRYPVRGAALAARLGVSLRTLYRDIATLQGQGAHIEGEPGLGYVLRPGFTLPPLTFTDDEVEALVLGARWVVDRGDAPLGEAARHALAKIAAVLPAERRAALEQATLLVGPAVVRPKLAASDAPTASRDPVVGALGTRDADAAAIRRAIRTERKLVLTYRDLRERETARTVWPFALAYFDRVRVLVAWCELRQGYRHFRPDRITALTPTAERYPRPRHALLAEWRAGEGIAARAADKI